MSVDSSVAILDLRIDLGKDAEPDELDRLTRQLRRELQELEIELAELSTTGPAPEGAKSGEAVTLGALLVAVLPVALPKVVEFLQAWTLRGTNRTLKIKAQVGDRSLDVECAPGTMSRRELKALIDRVLNAPAPASTPHAAGQ